MPKKYYLCNVFTYSTNGEVEVYGVRQESTTVENISYMNKSIMKRIENGQLIIIRDGVKYDITGSVIR